MARKKKTENYAKLHQDLINKTRSVYDSNAGKELSNLLSSGQNSYLRFSRYESSSMDLEWVKRVLDCIPDLSDIVTNPKKTIQTLEEVVQIEKVKKIGVETVQHLSSHTQYIKTVDENGNVTPSKLLNIYNDDYYAIYENKFVATLLRHLLIFVEKRYELLKNQAKMQNVQVLAFKNYTELDGASIEIETKVKYTKSADEEARERLKGYLKQIEDIRRYIKFYMRSEFMNILRREKDVRNPILQTNIIRKNPKYHKCYLLWMYIWRYRESGLDIKIQEDYEEITKDDMKHINQANISNFLLLKGKDFARKSFKKKKVYKPIILNTYDDDIYKPAYYDGPVEFVRIDDKYREYTETLYELNPHPSKAFKEFEKDKYEFNRLMKEKTKQIEALKIRKIKEGEAYEEGERQAALREKARDEYVDALAEKEIREEAIARTEKVRRKVVKAAKNDKKHFETKEVKAKEAKKK